MMILRTAKDMAAFVDTARKAEKKIAFVATMGALHEGHLTLMRDAKKRGDALIASIFVNPKQFNDPEDYKKYARDLPGDLKKCESAGVDVVFTPSEEEIYPPNEKVPAIPLPEVAKPLEGKCRPGHFEGVVAVVSRLFRIVQPDAAIFGMKDYQQVRVIEEMVRQQKMDVMIIRHPTIREPDGLAMSSRNTQLSVEGRRTALNISKSLKAAEYLFQKGERDPRKIESALQKGLLEKKIQFDYVSLVDAETLGPISVIVQPTLVAVAAFVDGVRLIDNCLLE